MSGEILDLFGNGIAPVRERGRPAHVWTLENSNKVNLLFACGRKPIEIARVLRISKPTFYKHYFNEVANAGHAPLMMKALQLSRLNAQAEAGNVAAEKALAAMIQAERMQAQSAAFSDKPKAAPRKGLKDERRDQAWMAGAEDKDWGDLIGPDARPN